jgi:hypothetical protein
LPIARDRVEALLTSPIGASLLDELERRSPVWSSRRVSPFVALPESNPGAVAGAIEGLASTGATELLERVFRAASNVGAWAGGGPQNAARSLALARERVALARALVERPDVDAWSDGMTAEQWWWSDGAGLRDRRLGPGRGRFPAWATRPEHQVLTTSPLDLALTDSLADSWEMIFGPLTLWRIEVPTGARVYEIDGPEAWAALVMHAPQDSTGLYGQQHASWELRRIGTGPDDVEALLELPGQRAARRGWRRMLTPDWDAVAADWDAVHLTWFGFVTADGVVSDLGDGDVTILRHWGSERTVWLQPVLADPQPMPAPPRTDRVGMGGTPDPRDRSPDAERRWLLSVACA